VEPKKKTPPKPSATRTRGKVPPRPGPGARTTLTLAKLEKIAKALRGGNYITTACQYAGIGESTYHKWRARGEAELDRVDSLPRTNLEAIMATFDGTDPNTIDDTTGKPVEKSTPAYMWDHCPRQFDRYEWPYAVFSYITETASAEAEIRAVTSIMVAGQKSWQAHAWWCERRFPEKYGQRTAVTLGGAAGGAPIRTENQTVVTVSELDAVLGQLIDKRQKQRGRRDKD
jgi:hypothetical protein